MASTIANPKADAVDDSTLARIESSTFCQDELREPAPDVVVVSARLLLLLLVELRMSSSSAYAISAFSAELMLIPVLSESSGRAGSACVCKHKCARVSVEY